MESLAISDLLVVVLVLVALLVIYSSIGIAQENERFAVFMLGHFVRFAGPGMVMKTVAMRFVRLKVGDIGTVTSQEFVKFGDADIPFGNLESFAVGEPVKIDGFDGTEPRLASSALRPKTRCPECGHEF